MNKNLKKDEKEPDFSNIENLQYSCDDAQIFVDSKTSFGTFQIRQRFLPKACLRGI